MFIITECPRCNNDFMYHSSDTHLIRTDTILDEVGNNEVVDIVICQDCNEEEIIINSNSSIEKAFHNYSFHLFIL